MQKKIVAMAVAAALATPALALADNGNVTIYGKLHVSLDQLNDKNVATPNDTRLAQNSSRLGFKGTEDLGDGLKIEWQMEQGVDATGAAGGSLFSPSQRDTWIGLAGSFGSIRAGRLAGANDWLGDAELFGDQAGAANNFLGQGGYRGDAGADDRLSSAIKYISPKFNGFNLLLTYAPSSSDASAVVTTARESATGIRLAYADGPIKAGLTHWKFADAAATSPTATALGGAYDFGQWLVTGQVVQFKDEKNSSTGAGNAAADHTNWSLGGKFKVGAGAVKAQYSKAGSMSTVADSSASQIALGYDYSFSKRTMLYVNYAQVSNGAGVDYAPYVKGKDTPGTYDPDTNAVNGVDPSVFTLGIVHDF